jgi:hypothetical protein
MPFNARYTPTEMSILLETALTPISCYADNGELKQLTHGDTEKPYGYFNTHSLVLFPVTDRVEQQPAQLRTIDVGIVDLKDQINKALGASKKIIIPVVENQKILGLFPRAHFVTLVYDPQMNTATLIDSRPWLISFLYPTKPMESMLRDGLAQVLSSEQMEGLKFKKVFQGVQHNDTHCGAWTAANIMGLAGVGVDEPKEPNNVNQQAHAFTRDDEVDVVNNNINIANKVCSNPIDKLSKPTGWFQKLLIRLGFTKYKFEPKIELRHLTSYEKIVSELPVNGPSKDARTDEWDIVSTDSVISTVIIKPEPFDHASKTSSPSDDICLPPSI